MLKSGIQLPNKAEGTIRSFTGYWNSLLASQSSSSEDLETGILP